MATRKAAKKTAAKKAVAKKTAAKMSGKAAGAVRKVASKQTAAMPKAGKDPRGGLTAKGREFFNQRDGSHLRPGVKGAADTPEKMVRKGSFLRRHFTHPRGPMVDAQGRPTRLALSAQAWGEPLPKTLADAKKLADKGHQLLESYHQQQAAVGEKSTGKKAVKRAVKKEAKKIAAKKVSAKSR